MRELNQTILHQTGLSERELRDYVRKLIAFYGKLSPGQKRVFLCSMHSRRDAIRSFDPDLTAGQLTQFLRALMGPEEASQIVVEGVEGRPSTPQPDPEPAT